MQEIPPPVHLHPFFTALQALFTVMSLLYKDLWLQFRTLASILSAMYQHLIVGHYNPGKHLFCLKWPEY